VRDGHIGISAYGHAGKIMFFYDQVRGERAQDRFPDGAHEYEVRGVVLCLQSGPHGSGF
jgi:hypothetical protein